MNKHSADLDLGVRYLDQKKEWVFFIDVCQASNKYQWALEIKRAIILLKYKNTDIPLDDYFFREHHRSKMLVLEKHQLN